MTLSEMKKKVLALIEELNPESEYLTDDPDIATKMETVITQIMFELARYKKIPDYVEMDVEEGDLIRFEDITDESDYEVYQISMIRGVEYESKAQGTVIKCLESGTAEIEYFRYPTRITDKNRAKYQFELSEDVLEIMPYGVAGDLLKSDVSTEYGVIYSRRYEAMIQQLDPRYAMTSIYIDGGVNI
ncbi:MAG: hypothetical protein E7288_10490 [Lachnospiraceae bacterium]|nr:hypothetical protein [Lachnospiraceae bacterium]